MHKLTCKEIIDAVNGKLISGSIDAEFFNVTIDSRKVSEGDLFLPIIGDRFDGHDFIQASLDSGATGTLTQNEIGIIQNKVVIKVSDTSKALRDIAAFYRKKFNIPFVAITGSVGKTSTKDMIASVLSQKLNVLKTEGNFNNEIGLPLTVLNLDSFHQAAIIEMGMSGFGEISRLSAITNPDIAIVTNIGLAHIEKLGSRQNILKAKMEILEGLKSNGLVILNGDDKLLFGLKNFLGYKTVFYGLEDDVDYQAYNVNSAGENGTYFQISIKNNEYKVHVPVPGIHNVYNALAAFAVGIEMNISIEKIIKGIAEYKAGKMRLNIMNHNGIKIINDTYNASPQSMEAALCVLKDIAGNNRTIAVLGDMLEMGDWSYKAHTDVGKFAVSKGVDYIITVGEYANNIIEGAEAAGVHPGNVMSFKCNEDISDFLSSFIRNGDAILVKGSRGMAMEQIVDNLLNYK